MENNNFERTTPIVSIIMPVYFNDHQHGKYGEHESFWFAGECLRRLQAVTPRELYELIIIDNGSYLGVDDLEISLGKETYAGKHIAITPDEYFEQADILIRNSKNLGFGPACNQGFALARGKYIICINNDVLVWEEWLETMINDFEERGKSMNPAMGVLMPALVGGLRDANRAIKMKKEEVNMNIHAGQFGAGAEFGSLWMMERRVMEFLKTKDGYYFDENFKCGFGEDRDLWKRVRSLNLETYRTHNTRVFHQGNMTMCKISGRKNYTLPNREYLAKKWNINK